MASVTRRDFMKRTVGLGIAVSGLGNLLPGTMMNLRSTPTAVKKDLVVVKNGQAAQMVRKALETLGGMSQFVKKKDVVVVKPNIGWDRVPAQAANTNPDLVAEVVRLCLEAGASKVKIFDRTCNEPRRCYLRSGIEEAAKNAGAEVRHIYERKFKTVAIPQGEVLKAWEFYQDALEADVFINLPIAKHHSMSRLSMALKNMMGILGGDRGQIHNDFAHKIVDINMVLRPQLTILDAVRVLVRNGPQGGNLADVRLMNTIVASVDPVAVDSYGATLFGLKSDDLEYLKIAHERGLGEMDLGRLNITTVSL